MHPWDWQIINILLFYACFTMSEEKSSVSVLAVRGRQPYFSMHAVFHYMRFPLCPKCTDALSHWYYSFLQVWNSPEGTSAPTGTSYSQPELEQENIKLSAYARRQDTASNLNVRGTSPSCALNFKNNHTVQRRVFAGGIFFFTSSFKMYPHTE